MKTVDVATKHQTKELENWAWAKDIRARYYNECMTAKEQGTVLVSGGALTPVELLGGVGKFIFFQGEPYGASCAAADPLQAVQLAEEAEARGYSRDLCAYLRIYLGSMFANAGPYGGYPEPDFFFQAHHCDSHSKWYQVAVDHLRVPYFVIDCPLYNLKQKQAHVAYLAEQFSNFIEWTEKTLGRPYDDEGFLHALDDVHETELLWSEITDAAVNVPAPLNLRHMYSLYPPAIAVKYRDEGVAFYRALRDEVKDRVAAGIGAVPEEKARLLHDNIPPWHKRLVWRYAEQYGAVLIGSPYVSWWGASWSARDDGTIGYPDQLGVKPTNREEAVWHLADWYYERVFWGAERNTACLLKMIDDYKADGVVFHLNRGCEGLAQGQLEARLAVQAKGVPAMAYEGNSGDVREYDEKQVLDRFDAFLEGLGLSKIR